MISVLTIQPTFLEGPAIDCGAPTTDHRHCKRYTDFQRAKGDVMAACGPLLPTADPAGCPQLVEGDIGALKA
jgi:hypothetical protein